MQPMQYLRNWLENNANEEHYLFSFQDLRALFPNLTDIAFKTLLSRASHSLRLIRISKGLYAYEKSIPKDGHFLFHVASRLRADEFNYISLETVLSEAGIISQVPINWITIMSSGRSNIISCGKYGAIEFIHTRRKANDVINEVIYDAKLGLWRANIHLALKDMKMTRRNMDLIDWEAVNESI